MSKEKWPQLLKRPSGEVTDTRCVARIASKYTTQSRKATMQCTVTGRGGWLKAILKSLIQWTKSFSKNKRTPDWLFIRNMTVSPVYAADANVQGLSRLFLQTTFVDAKLKSTELYRTATSLRRTVVKFTKQVWHYNKFWHAQMEGRQVHIPDGFDDVPSPVFPSILDIEKALDVNPTLHFSIRRDTLQLIPY